MPKALTELQFRRHYDRYLKPMFNDFFGQYDVTLGGLFWGSKMIARFFVYGFDESDNNFVGRLGKEWQGYLDPKDYDSNNFWIRALSVKRLN